MEDDGSSDSLYADRIYVKSFKSENGDDYFLLTEQNDPKSHYSLIVTDGSSSYKGNFKLSDAGDGSGRLSSSELCNLTSSALTDECDLGNDLIYSVQQKDGNILFSWKQPLAGGQVKRLIGKVELKPCSTKESMMSTLSSAVKIVQNKNQCLERTKMLLNKLQGQHNDCLAQLEESASAKKAMEEELFGKFMVVLNCKKEKIAALQTEVQKLRSKSSGSANNDQISEEETGGEDETVIVEETRSVSKRGGGNRKKGPVPAKKPKDALPSRQRGARRAQVSKKGVQYAEISDSSSDTADPDIHTTNQVDDNSDVEGETKEKDETTFMEDSRSYSKRRSNIRNKEPFPAKKPKEVLPPRQRNMRRAQAVKKGVQYPSVSDSSSDTDDLDAPSRSQIDDSSNDNKIVEDEDPTIIMEDSESSSKGDNSNIGKGPNPAKKPKEVLSSRQGSRRRAQTSKKGVQYPDINGRSDTDDMDMPTATQATGSRSSKFLEDLI